MDLAQLCFQLIEAYENKENIELDIKSLRAALNKAKLDNLTNQIRSTNEEINNLRRELEGFKTDPDDLK